MPFDSSKPAPGDDLDAVLVRSQLNGLKDIIDAAPTITAVVVDSVTTLDPGQPATASASLTGTTLHLTLGIPRGPDGAQGAPGPTFGGTVVDAVNTLTSAQPASVATTFDGANVHFTFGIPAGEQGIGGLVGPPGEVTTAAMTTAITDAVQAALINMLASSSANSNAVATLDTPFADPDSETLRAKVNELLLVMRR